MGVRGGAEEGFLYDGDTGHEHHVGKEHHIQTHVDLPNAPRRVPQAVEDGLDGIPVDDAEERTRRR